MEIEDVTLDQLLASRLISKWALKPKPRPSDERNRLDSLEHAKRRYLKNIADNTKLKAAMGAADEYAKWFEVFNGEPMQGNEDAILGMDGFAYSNNVIYAADQWKNRAKMAAMRKGPIVLALRDCKDGRHRRILRVRLQTPDWVDYDKIKEKYERRDRMTLETGIVHHVDHIVPLGGKQATGFHVHDNMQVITADENFEKRAHFDWSDG